MAGTEGALERVDIRDVWPNEGLDFTPWLAKNLHLLGDAIGMKLELVQREKIVGSMFLDILAKDLDTGRLVAIENLYGWTDIDHLGRLFIYAAGCNAPVLILIAEEFAYEHAQTLHQMNEWSKEGVGFYGVKVEAFRKTAEAPAEARFRKVVYPGCWDKEATLPLNQTPPHIQKYHDFYKPLVGELLRRDFADKAVQLWSYRGRRFPLQFDKDSDSGYAAYFSENFVWVYLHIRTWGSVERNNRIFDELLAQRDEIERTMGSALEWRWGREDSQTFSSISVMREGTIDDPPEKLDEIRAWMMDLLPKFKEVFDPRMAEILERLPSE